MNMTTLKRMTAVSAAAVFLTVGVATRAAAQDADQCTTPVPATFGDTGGTVQTCIDKDSLALLAGQTIPAGTLDITLTDPGTLTFTYTAGNTFALTGTHFWIGTSAEAIPTNKSGNPVPGQFPYKSGSLNNLASYTLPAFSLGAAPIEFACPATLDAYPEDGGPSAFSPYVVAAHAAMSSVTYGGQTAWSAGARLTDRGNWMTYSTLGLYCIYTPPAPVVELPPVELELRGETAFAYDPAAAQCFLDETDRKLLTSNRWGWTNGPYAPGDSRVLELWAGAGQCDLDKGELAGTVAFDHFSDGRLVATFTTTDGWKLEETHLYAGTDKYKCTTTTSTKKVGGVTTTTTTKDCTVAPGQYPAQSVTLDQVENDALTVGGLSGNVYVIAHAAVVKEVPQQQ